jgi:hypothetical protein
MKPTVRRLEEEFKDKVEFKAINIDDASSEAFKQQYNFIGQPQFVIVGGDGVVLSSRNGSQRYEKLKADIEQALAAVK